MAHPEFSRGVRKTVQDRNLDEVELVGKRRRRRAAAGGCYGVPLDGRASAQVWPAWASVTDAAAVPATTGDQRPSTVIICRVRPSSRHRTGLKGTEAQCSNSRAPHLEMRADWAAVFGHQVKPSRAPHFGGLRSTRA